MTEDPKIFWDSISEKHYRKYILPNRTDKEFESEGISQAKWLKQFLNSSDVIIDYGCGIGRVTRYMASYCGSIIGLDICTKFIELARQRNADLSNIRFESVLDYKNQTNVADFIFSLMVLQHNNASDRLIIINDIKRLLKPSGISIINFPKKSSSHYKETGFVKTFTKSEVSEYGDLFQCHEIIEDNLILLKGADMSEKHEYFLLVTN